MTENWLDEPMTPNPEPEAPPENWLDEPISIETSPGTVTSEPAAPAPDYTEPAPDRPPAPEPAIPPVPEPGAGIPPLVYLAAAGLLAIAGLMAMRRKS